MKFISKEIYAIFCKFYSNLATFIENKFLKGEYLSENHLEDFGYIKIYKSSKLNNSVNKLGSIFSNNLQKIDINEYHKRLILNKKDLTDVLSIIFNKEFCEFITLQTGFKYIVDYLGAYQNLPIPQNKKNQAWYANHYHLDKPNSKNMLKIFLPISEIGIEDGPLELIDLNQTKNYYLSNKCVDNFEKIFLLGGLGDIFLSKLNICLHRAGIPKTGRKTSLIMIQLNPSDNWYLNDRIYERQFKKEPKFTSFINLFVGKKLLTYENN